MEKFKGKLSKKEFSYIVVNELGGIQAAFWEYDEAKEYADKNGYKLKEL